MSISKNKKQLENPDSQSENTQETASDNQPK
jgi:hypothetical protein